MIYNTDSAAKIAESLLQIKAIKLNNKEPFTWASGLKSPIYCDNRVALSYPKIRTYIRQQIVEAIEDKFGQVDVIAGVATAGIPQAALVAAALGLPLVYVRSSEKKHGMTNKIEGVINEGQSVVVIEDLVSTGKSSLNAVDALKDAGASVKGMVAIFTYGLQKAEDNFENANCQLVTLSDYDVLVNIATENEYISNNDLLSLMDWRKDPQAWSDARK
ncbi:MAG: orotate phosphoribosyltransferase [Marinilabiliales bacterium]|nr:MAG: orotate phosphoribosyltransferase [Marinilabiliales bacterium]